MYKISFAVSLTLLACIFSQNFYANSLDIAQTHLDANENEQAIAVLQELNKQESTANIEYLLAVAYQNSNQLNLAVKHAEQAVIQDPKVSNHHLAYAETQGQILASGDGGIMKKLGLVKRVKRSFISAVNLDPNNIRARSGLSQFYLMAPGIAGGSKKKALQQAQAVFKLDKQKAYPMLTNVYRSSKKNKKVLETLTAWKNDFPDDWNAVISIARYEQDHKNNAKSYETINNWLEKNPEDLAAKYQLGRLAATTGEFLKQGESSLKSYLNSPISNGQPEYQWAHYRIAMIYMHQKQPEIAKEHINKGLLLDPDNKELIKLKAKL